jgi:membrane fusion protein (multidrug efflux system)
LHRRRWSRVILSGILLTFIIAFALRIKDQPREIPQARPAMGPRLERITVQVEAVGRGDVEEIAVLSGTLEPQFQVDIHPRLAGPLAQLAVEVGQRVEAGDLIGVIDNTDLAASRAGYRRSQSQVERLREDYERTKELYQRRAATQQELEQKANQLKEGEIQLEIAGAQLEQAEANFALVELQLDRVRVTTPVAGVVMETGALPGANVGTGTALATVAAIDPIDVVFSIPERQIQRIALDQELTIQFDAYPGEFFPGRVTRLGSSIDPRTRTLTVRAAIPNPQLRLRPGMFARVELVMERREDVITIPTEAVLTRTTGQYVFLAEDNMALLRPVTLGVQGRERVEITAGLVEGELVVTVGQQQLREGQPVEAITEYVLPEGIGGNGR